jgi:hypothetical protein
MLETIPRISQRRDLTVSVGEEMPVVEVELATSREIWLVAAEREARD